jgi:hypothetical protein
MTDGFLVEVNVQTVEEPLATPPEARMGLPSYVISENPGGIEPRLATKIAQRGQPANRARIEQFPARTTDLSAPDRGPE